MLVSGHDVNIASREEQCGKVIITVLSSAKLNGAAFEEIDTSKCDPDTGDGGSSIMLSKVCVCVCVGFN